MVQDFLLALYRWLLDGAATLIGLLPVILAAAVAAAALWIALLKWAPERASEVGSHFRPLSKKSGAILGTLLLTCLLAGFLVQAKKLVENRRVTVQEASASRRNEPNLGTVQQYAPSVSVLQDRTYTRTLTIPPSVLERVGVEGVQVLSPYLTDPSSENVLKLVDSFRRSGSDVVFTRELTRRDETAAAADSANIEVTFASEGSASGQRHYRADFKGAYRFKNPTPQSATMKFTFALPSGGGTIQGFKLIQGDQTISDPDQNGQYSWQGEVPPGQSVEVDAQYTISGSGSYDYWIGTDRRRTGDFKFVARSDSEPQFAKNGIFPTRVEGATSEWHLTDVMTNQTISLVFPRQDASVEVFDKTLWFLPLVLVIVAVGALLLGLPRPILTALAFGIGLLVAPVLGSYTTPLLATLAAGVLAALLGVAVQTDTRGRLLCVSGGLLSLIFLSGDHGGFLAWLFALGLVLILVWRRPSVGGTRG